MSTTQPKTQSSITALILSFLIGSLLISSPIKAQNYPAGFQQVLVANGISNPTVMAFAPDGRLFVAQQAGALRIIENGVLLSTPAITLSVNSSGERGLLGIAFDPNFTSNNFIYLYYTFNKNNTCATNVSNGPVNRVARRRHPPREQVLDKAA